MEKKGSEVSGKMILPNAFLDNYIAHKLSELTECGAPDLSAEKGAWVNTFILNSALRVTIPGKEKALLFNFVRRAEGAFSSYLIARCALEKYVSTPSNMISPYFEALLYFEFCISQAYQGFDLFSKLSGEKVFKKGAGSSMEKLHGIYIDSKHMDSMIKGEKLPHKASTGLWITNKGIESARSGITFGDLSDILKLMANIAREAGTLSPPNQD